jgi:hypothetical protein
MYDIKLALRLALIKSSQAISSVSWLKTTGDSVTNFVLFIRGIMIKEMVPETSLF